MTHNPMKTKDGRLTAYGLSCGYMEVHKLKNGVFMQMDKNLSLYRIRVNNADNHRLLWNTFERLSDARKQFDDIKNGVLIIS